MSEKRMRMFARSVSSATVTLVRELNAAQDGNAGTGIIDVVVTTSEATAEPDFWGVTGSCGRYEVIFRKLS